MKSYSISGDKFAEIVSLAKENYQLPSHTLDAILSGIINQYKGVNVILLEREDLPSEVIRNSFKHFYYPIFLEAGTFTDEAVFKNFKEKPTNAVVFANIIDTLEADSLGIIRHFDPSKASAYADELISYPIAILTYMLTNMAKRLYGRESSGDIDFTDKIAIVTTYGVYRYILQYEPSIARIKAIDLLNDSKVLLTSNKYRTRTQITLVLNRYISDDAKDMYDLYVLSGLFAELLSKKQFIQTLAQYYTLPLTKALLASPNKKISYENTTLYLYRAILLAITDILQMYKVYSRLSRLLSDLNPTVEKIVDRMLKDVSKLIRK